MGYQEEEMRQPRQTLSTGRAREYTFSKYVFECLLFDVDSGAHLPCPEVLALPLTTVEAEEVAPSPGPWFPHLKVVLS